MASEATPASGYEDVPTKDLKPHPRNYRGHPDDQIDHIVQSLTEFDQYRNVVVADDNTVLAGHGVVTAALKDERPTVTVKRMPFGPDDPRAIKLLTLDNEVTRLADVDDRSLTELLKDIKENSETGLLGTGFDEQRLAALLFVTRDQTEIEDFDAAAEWVGMPEYETGELASYVKVKFKTPEQREQWLKDQGYDASTLIQISDGKMTKGQGGTVSVWWPPAPTNELLPVAFKEDEDKAKAE